MTNSLRVRSIRRSSSNDSLIYPFALPLTHSEWAANPFDKQQKPPKKFYRLRRKYVNLKRNSWRRGRRREEGEEGGNGINNSVEMRNDLGSRVFGFYTIEISQTHKLGEWKAKQKLGRMIEWQNGMIYHGSMIIVSSILRYQGQFNIFPPPLPLLLLLLLILSATFRFQWKVAASRSF